MPLTRLAAIADVHGNRWALEAVLADAARRGVEALVNLGDCLYGPLDPAGTAELLLGLGLPTVRGNEDRLIVEPWPAGPPPPTLRFSQESLAPAQLRWLAALPLTAIVHDDFFLCHGTPQRDDEYLLTEVSASGAAPRPPADVAARLAGVTQPVVLCAHDHASRVVTLEDGRLVVNPGSVGCPAYDDDHPHPHVMQTGTPHARYAVLTRDARGWGAELVAVTYDWEVAAATAQRHGRPDWARWLRTGRAQPL